MNKLLASLALLPLLACAHARPPGSPSETTVTIQDSTGSEMIGEIRVLGLDGAKVEDKCNVGSTSCEVAVPAGVYLLKFHKMRGGRLATLHTPGAGGKEKGAFCMLSRVKLVPGAPIVCKANGDLDFCRDTRVHTMNCGPAVVQVWNPTNGEPLDIDLYKDGQ